jgi:hypothetical protein
VGDVALGGVYPVAWDVYDDTGALVNAATVTLTITLPDGTGATPAVTNPPAVTGKYRYLYTTTQAGRHAARAAMTGPAVVYDAVFDVDPAPPPAIVSLATAKQKLGITGSAEDGKLTAWLAAVTGVIETVKGEVITRRAITEYTYGHGSTFRLWNTPVISITSITSQDGTATWDPANMSIQPSGLVRVKQGPPVRGPLTVAEVAGYAIIPADYQEASLVILQNLWETDRGVMPVALGGEGEAPPPQFFGLIPRRAAELLGVKRPPVA